MSNSGGAAHHRGADGATAAGQCSCLSLISRASPDLWPGGAEISFCHTIDHCKTTLYYTVLYLDLAPRRRYCGLFTLLYRPGSLPGAKTLTEGFENGAITSAEELRNTNIDVRFEDNGDFVFSFEDME